MNIAILAAGAGDMYCGSCLRDNAMATALKRLGHEVSLIPLYTPLRTDTDDATTCEVFYGGVNVYLQHATAFFRHTPRVLDWIFDRGWLLRTAGNWGAQTSPDQVAGLTADIISGADGAGRKELNRLIAFLKDHVRPDIVSLPNLMFIGLADAIRQAMDIPVVCELTGEDIFLDAMSDSNRTQIRELIQQRAGSVSRYISTTDYYAVRMAEYLNIPRDRIDVVPTGLSPDFFTPIANRDRVLSQPPVVGYLARMCPEKGLDRLVDAMLILRQKPGMENVRLRAAGYLGLRDQKWFDALRKRIEQSSLRDGFEFLGTVDRAGKISMLDSLDVMSVPTAYPEAKGIYILEALARGVPVVQPAHGSFPQVIDQTGGGLLVPPGDAAALADAIVNVLSDDALKKRLSAAGRAAVESTMREEQMATKLIGIFQALR